MFDSSVKCSYNQLLTAINSLIDNLIIERFYLSVDLQNTYRPVVILGIFYEHFLTSNLVGKICIHIQKWY